MSPARFRPPDAVLWTRAALVVLMRGLAAQVGPAHDGFSWRKRATGNGPPGHRRGGTPPAAHHRLPRLRPAGCAAARLRPWLAGTGGELAPPAPLLRRS